MSVLRQTVRFLGVGLLNTALGLAVIYAVMLVPGASPALANAVGYAVGLALSFALHRAWTFGCQGRSVVLLPEYLLAVAVSYALNLSVLLGALSYLRMNPFLAQLAGVAVYTPSLFALSRWWVFRARGPHGVELGSMRSPSADAG